ncbi:MAG: elongation factor P maturation arginine rhamnosyltransferase EarP [Rhodoferax sp.]|nr:elongation factor P maturation arginine rhamnosyltransferase EarP [Rhodoferax sp.]
MPDNPYMLWDIFCRVIDNFGDIGVCWRLAADLAGRGHGVRLWVDDGAALRWMAPGAVEGKWANVQVLDWRQSHDSHFLAQAQLAPADVWIEGFGCNIAPEFIAARARSISGNGINGINGIQKPVWINLEYLSAEGYVERAHGLPSPVQSGEAQGWTKYFYYPGFTKRTGGLLREPDMAQRQADFAHADQRRAWLARHGITWQGERLVALFCYEPAALPYLLTQWASDTKPTRLLVTSGRSSMAIRTALMQQNSLQPSWNVRGQLSISYLPCLTQDDFDQLLWLCDLNFVRGEDSLVRALWAGKPLVWQIYPQDDGAHRHKLDAFLDMLQADDSLRAWHQAWNQTGTDALTFPDYTGWAHTVQAARARMLQMDDLLTQLERFVAKKR